LVTSIPDSSLFRLKAYNPGGVELPPIRSNNESITMEECTIDQLQRGISRKVLDGRRLGVQVYEIVIGLIEARAKHFILLGKIHRSFVILLREGEDFLNRKGSGQ
jgi:hypothetical protein